MEIILRQHVPGLGYKDDVVTVKSGYARNYLIPQGMAVVANVGNRKTATQNLQQAAKKAESVKAEALGLVAKLGDEPVIMQVKAGGEGRIFGTVTAIQIATAIESTHGIAVEPRSIQLIKPIKTLGNHTVTLNLHREVVHVLSLVVKGDTA